MKLEEFLTKYTKIMKPNEVEEIENIDIREIKRKTSEQIWKTFLDEKNIPDSELEKEMDAIHKKERVTLTEYYYKHFLNEK